MKKDALIKKLQAQLEAVRSERQAGKRDPAMHAARTALKQYQSDRLAATHADLLANPDTHGAALFFLEELYGAHDLSQRDIDLERIIPTMQRMLGYDALHAITEAIVLDALSERLDSRMAAALGTDFTEQQYIDAYRDLTTRAERERQLALVGELGEALCKLTCIPLLATMLTVMRKPAELAGLGDLQKFLERGFRTFKQMREPRRFVSTIVGREAQVLDQIHARRPHPFTLSLQSP